MRYSENIIEGRNAVLEALRAGKPIDRLFVLEGAHDNALGSILREAAGDSQKQKEQRQREAAQRSADLEEKVQQLADLVEEQGELTRETVGSLHQEPEEQAAPQPEAPKDRGISPALDLLERTAQENSAAPAPEEEEEEEQPASSRDKKRRKNPLRHEDEYVQEGLVSFFEKK